MIEEALFTLLTENMEVSGLIDDRLYPEGDVTNAPALPFVRYKRISTPHTNRTHDGKTYNAPRIDLDCYAKTPLTAKQVALAIDNAIDNYKGTVGDWRIDAIHVSNIRDYFDPENEEFICTVEIAIWAISN